MMNDPYDTGTPLYSTAQDIYEAICKMADTEEMSILSEMFEDITTDGRGYYYSDKAYELQEKIETITDYGQNMWILDLAVWKADENREVHSIVFDALDNSDLAKRIGFKKMFIDDVLYGVGSRYDKVTEEFYDELCELSRFSLYENTQALHRAASSCNLEFPQNLYSEFCNRLGSKLENIKQDKEIQLIIECRSLLSSYDDFLLGLKMNKALHDGLEDQYKRKVTMLNEAYENKMRQMLEIAQSKGLLEEFRDILKLPQSVGEG